METITISLEEIQKIVIEAFNGIPEQLAKNISEGFSKNFENLSEHGSPDSEDKNESESLIQNIPQTVFTKSTFTKEELENMKKKLGAKEDTSKDWHFNISRNQLISKTPRNIKNYTFEILSGTKIKIAYPHGWTLSRWERK